MSSDNKGWLSFFAGGTFAFIAWLFTGGLMLLHIGSVVMGYTSLILGGAGLFVPPLGIINGIVFVATGDSLEQYF